MRRGGDIGALTVRHRRRTEGKKQRQNRDIYRQSECRKRKMSHIQREREGGEAERRKDCLRKIKTIHTVLRGN